MLSKVVNCLKTGWPQNVNISPYTRRMDELSVQQVCFLWGSRVVIPAPGREELLDDLHECHSSIVRMKGSARSFLSWPGLDAEIEVKVRSCVVCQEHSKLPSKQICTHGNGQANRGIVYTSTMLAQ